MHHIELWTNDIEMTAPSFDWLLISIGWRAAYDPAWPTGRIWRHPEGVYVVLEQSPDVSGAHERTLAGLNHLAVAVKNRAQLDKLRAECSRHGWQELFADKYPHAGGQQHIALFVENAEGFEIELVSN